MLAGCADGAPSARDDDYWHRAARNMGERTVRAAACARRPAQVEGFSAACAAIAKKSARVHSVPYCRCHSNVALTPVAARFVSL